MFRNMTSDSLRMLARTEGTASALAGLLVIFAITSAFDLFTPSGWVMWSGLALCIAGWIVGRNADVELLHREAEREHEAGHDESWFALDVPVAIDDEGEPTGRNPR